MSELLYEEALKIRRGLAESNPEVFMQDVAVTLVSMSVFYLSAVPDKKKSSALAEEAVKILRPFGENVPDLEPYMEIAEQVLQVNRRGG
jgi:hypothetical protein